MSKRNIYAISGGVFALLAILATTGHNILLAILCFLVAIGCALRARSEWNRDHA